MIVSPKNVYHSDGKNLTSLQLTLLINSNVIDWLNEPIAKTFVGKFVHQNS